MVQILPRFDPGGEIGKAFGSGLGQGVSKEYDRQRLLQGLNSLSNIKQEDLQKMSFPDQMQTLMRPFVGLPGGEMMITEMMPKWMEYLQNMADIAPEDLSDPSNDAPADYTDEQKSLWSATDKINEVTGGSQPPNHPEDVTEEVKETVYGNDPEPLTKVGPSRQGLPNNMPGQVREMAAVFPEIRAMALRGNPQGLSFDEKLKYTNQLTQRRVPKDQAIRRVEDLSNYLQQQAGAFQDIQNKVTEEAQSIYGGTPYYSMFQRQMQAEADKQVDEGLMEPNSVINAARQKAKNLETVINNARSAKGRPVFEIGVEDRQKGSANWVAPLIKNGEIQTATELLMKSDIPLKDGTSVPGPDWGPVRATEIVQSQLKGSDVIPRTIKFAESLPDMRVGTFAQDPFGGATRRKKVANRGMQQLEDYIVNDLQPQDSLVLLRAYAKEKGVEEDEFRTVLEKAKQRRGDEFSEYQNWEESTLLPYDVKPSLYEVFTGKRKWSDFWQGKK